MKNLPPYQFFIKKDRWQLCEESKFSPTVIVHVSDYIVNKSGRLVKSRTSRSNKRFTAKDIREFDGFIINNIQ